MSRTLFLFALLAMLFIGSLTSSARAQALAIRTFVSTTGSDSNPCSITAPCRHFQAAVDVTAVGGEVDALDPGGYGSFTINQAVTIEGQGWSYVAPPTGGNGITVNAISGYVTIRGVSLNGVGVTGTTNGIMFNSGDSLNVQNSVLKNFSNAALYFEPNSSSQLYISDTIISDSGNNGIVVDELSGNGAVGSFDHLRIENLGGGGISVQAGVSSQTSFTISNSVITYCNLGLGFQSENDAQLKVTISDSVVANNRATGIETIASGSSTTGVLVRNSTVANTFIAAALSAVNGGTIWVTRSSIYGNNSGIAGNVISYGDNTVINNTSNSSFSSTLTNQ
jgi:hypothetical protein